jgi:hypothetical protein
MATTAHSQQKTPDGRIWDKIALEKLYYKKNPHQFHQREKESAGSLDPNEPFLREQQH